MRKEYWEGSSLGAKRGGEIRKEKAGAEERVKEGEN